MKKQAYTIIAMLVLVGATAVAAQAQWGNHTELLANIPFEFNVGDKLMPAGKYLVSQINPASSLAVLQIRSSDGKATALIQMNAVRSTSRDKRASLNFTRYGSQHFFAQAWIPGNDGLKSMKSKTERGLQKEMAGIKPQVESVALRTR